MTPETEKSGCAAAILSEPVSIVCLPFYTSGHGNAGGPMLYWSSGKAGDALFTHTCGLNNPGYFFCCGLKELAEVRGVLQALESAQC